MSEFVKMVLFFDKIVLSHVNFMRIQSVVKSLSLRAVHTVVVVFF